MIQISKIILKVTKVQEVAGMNKKVATLRGLIIIIMPSKINLKRTKQIMLRCQMQAPLQNFKEYHCPNILHLTKVCVIPLPKNRQTRQIIIKSIQTQ